MEILASLAIGGLAFSLLLLKLKNSSGIENYELENVPTLYELSKGARDDIIDILSSNIEGAKSAEEEWALKEQKKALSTDLMAATLGNLSAGEHIKAMTGKSNTSRLKGFSLDQVVPFHSPDDMTGNELFESVLVLIRNYKLQPKQSELDWIHENYNLLEIVPKHYYAIDSNTFTLHKLKRIYADLYPYLKEEDKVLIIEQLTFAPSRYGAVDSLRFMDVDGFNFGASGRLDYAANGDFNEPYKYTNSVWVQYKATWIHFFFLDMIDHSEMLRVATMLASDDNDGLSKANPMKVTAGLHDNARISTVVPPVGEGVLCCVRKANVSGLTLRIMLQRDRLKGWRLVYLVMYLIVTAGEQFYLTGNQNSGKTTMLRQLVLLKLRKNIRVMEKSNELQIRKVAPQMNSFTLTETDNTSISKIQSQTKKLDSSSVITGEIADPTMTVETFQTGLTGNGDTTWTQHGLFEEGSIIGSANDLVASGAYADFASAIDVVLKVMKWNIHMQLVDIPVHAGGGTERVCWHISEIIQTATYSDYPDELPGEDMLAYANRLNREYYLRTTDRVRFKTRRLVYFDYDNLEYKPGVWMSPTATRRILSNFGYERDKAAFHMLHDVYFKGNLENEAELDNFIDDLIKLEEWQFKEKKKYQN